MMGPLWRTHIVAVPPAARAAFRERRSRLTRVGQRSGFVPEALPETLGRHLQRKGLRMMKTLRLGAALAVLATVVGWGVSGAESRVAPRNDPPGGETLSPSAVIGARAKIVPVLSVEKSADLDFGEVGSGNTPGTVVLPPQGARSATGGVRLGNPGRATSARIEVVGMRRTTYALTLPTSMILTDGSHTMLVDTFRSHAGNIGTLNGEGEQALRLGATLHLGANQTPGDYAGTFVVTVAYN